MYLNLCFSDQRKNNYRLNFKNNPLIIFNLVSQLIQLRAIVKTLFMLMIIFQYKIYFFRLSHH